MTTNLADMLLKEIATIFSGSSDFKKITDSLKNPGKNSPSGRASVEGISPNSFALIISSYFIETGSPLFVFCPTAQKMTELAADISSYLGNDVVSVLPPLETIPYEFISPSENIERQRVSALYGLLKSEKKITVATAETATRYLPSPKHLMKKGIALKTGEEYPFDLLIESFVEYGYTREIRVETYGQFSVKGSIIDIYPPSSDSPIRLDFFGDTLDSIREFDLETQVSVNKTESVEIFPRKELILSADEKKAASELLKKAYIKGFLIPDGILEILEKGIVPDNFTGIEDFFTEIMPKGTIFEYMPKDTDIIFIEHNEVQAKINEYHDIMRRLFERKTSKHFCLPPEKLIHEPDLSSGGNKRINLQVFKTSTECIDIAIRGISSFQGRIKNAREEIAKFSENGWRVVITTGFEGQLRRLSDLFAETHPEIITEDRPLGNTNIVQTHLSGGMEIDSIKTVILTDHDIFGKSYRRKKSFKGKSSKAINSFLDIKPGDHVVHLNHGIGLFKRIERRKELEIEKDYIIIEYAEGDILGVPLDQLSMVQLYVSFDGKPPRIDSIGKKSAWNRIKEKVQESIEEIANDLLEIYAKRSALKGTQFPPDTMWQEEFEAKFEYDETPDQITAIEDVKDDMESIKPMDRLICGDVGFGKTEVAIRAAFKAAVAGKQVALLVPTTILAMQHFRTFKKRFETYPITIELISRFKSKQEIKSIKEKISAGSVDIVIGTHAILAKDVFFKNLGLLIIDEEQRFGVKHKERLKKFRSLVDVLTLSATPIPRTLHMSLSGIRDLSIIETPPEHRQAVETFVLEDNPSIVQEAIRREIERDGQVFIVHNNIKTIEAEAISIKELVPEARVGIAHGQMDEIILEDIMIDFLEKKFDILICTTIIESGIDMPNVNTIIINRADTFGLSQLYQLKGRVGRSSVKGYAYLFHPRHMSMTETAQKRLEVISEYTDLGSGFKIAMKDLEIRGSGNLLGKDQSGNIMDVGFDLYCSMLEEAVKKIKGEKTKRAFRTAIFLRVNTFIPDSYISDEKQKIEIYKKFEGCESIDEIELLVSEIKDRFGEYGEEITTLIELEELRIKASELFIERIIEGEKSIRITITGDSLVDTVKLLTLIKKDKRFLLDPQDNQVLIFYPENKASEKKLQELKKWLQLMA